MGKQNKYQKWHQVLAPRQSDIRRESRELKFHQTALTANPRDPASRSRAKLLTLRTLENHRRHLLRRIPPVTNRHQESQPEQKLRLHSPSSICSACQQSLQMIS